MKKEKISSLVGILGITLTLFAFQVEVNALDGKLIMVPDDYPTIHGAIGDASDGDTIYVRKGIYEGPINQTLVINKTISLIGENPENTIVNLYPPWVFDGFWVNSPIYRYGNSILIQASDVEISGFTFEGQGTFNVNGYNTQINNNVINLYLYLACVNANVSRNAMNMTITVGGSGNIISKNSILSASIDVRGGSNHTISENYAHHIGVHSSSNKVFNNTVINGTGIALVFGSNNSVYGNILINNNFGLVLYVDGNNNRIYENYVADNNYALNFRLYFEGGENSTLYHNNFVNNTKQVKIDTPWADVYYGIFYFDNGKEGNYWSNYNGTDNDGDGIGETPFIIDEDRERQDNFPLMNPVEIEQLNIPVFPMESYSVFKEKTFHVHNEHDFYVIRIFSNSTISEFYYNLMKISFNISGTTGTTGFCRVSIPSELMSVEFSIYKDGIQLIKNTEYTETFNGTNYLFTFSYEHSTHLIEIFANNNIPEFPSWIGLIFILISSLSIVVKKKLWRKGV